MDLEKDTSVYLEEAHARGDDVFAFDSKDVTHKQLHYTQIVKNKFSESSELNFVIDSSVSIEVKEFDFVINRLNPPFNKVSLLNTNA